MQEKLSKARARAEILENEEFGAEQELQRDILGNHQQSLHSMQTKKENSSEKKEFSPEKNIVDALCHLVKQQSAPDIELDVFDGNPLDFHYFMTLFHEVVEKRIDNPRGRLARLLKYTSGNRKEISNTVYRNHQLCIINIPRRY